MPLCCLLACCRGLQPHRSRCHSAFGRLAAPPTDPRRRTRARRPPRLGAAPQRGLQLAAEAVELERHRRRGVQRCGGGLRQHLVHVHHAGPGAVARLQAGQPRGFAHLELCGRKKRDCKKRIRHSAFSCLCKLSIVWEIMNVLKYFSRIAQEIAVEARPRYILGRL